MKRVILIILDSFGVGAMPDACDYGDTNPDTFGNIFRSCGLQLPNLYSMGLSHIEGISVPKMEIAPTATYGRLAEKSKGKDTVTGHWELMGIVSERGFTIYENGFPAHFISLLEQEWGLNILGNKPASGTAIIDELGEEHIKTGSPIVYTSADSVLQIAAHEDIIPLDRLYELCSIARKLADQRNMGICRIIARPFKTDEKGKFYRTGNRRDYSLLPPEKTALDTLKDSGFTTLAIGKIEDIFSKQGISISHHTTNNAEGIDATIRHMKLRDSDFIFTNLVDFDMLYGHRRDPYGYKKALEYFDSRLSEILSIMTDEDMLIITADHGCDPTARGTDHTREYVPILIKYGRSAEAVDLGTVQGFDFVGKLVVEQMQNAKLSLGYRLPVVGAIRRGILRK